MHPFKPLSAKLRALFFILTMGGLVACNQFAQSAAEGDAIKVVPAIVKTDDIQEIQQLPKPGSIVHLKGTVRNRVPLLDGIVYELQDPTGTIWVVTKKPVPKQGDEVVIKGKLRYQTIKLGKKEQGSAYI